MSKCKPWPAFMKLKNDPDGHSCTSLGNDGVVRSVHSVTNEVIDAQGLSPDQIKEFVDLFPGPFRRKMNYDGVDGRNVSHEEMYRAPPKVEMSEAWKARIYDIMDKQKEIAFRAKDRFNLTPEESVERYTALIDMWHVAKISEMPEDPTEKKEAEEWNEKCDLSAEVLREGYDTFLDEQRQLKAQNEVAIWSLFPTSLLTLVAKKHNEKRQSTGSSPNQEQDGGLEWTLPVQIGTPAQTLNLDLDTGSSDLWVFSTELDFGDTRGQHLYNAAKSSTSKRVDGASWEISYADGSGAAGDVNTDTVSIGPLTVGTQTVELANSLSEDFAADYDKDGILGLAFNPLNKASPNKAKTWWSNIKSTLKSQVFTANLNNDADGTYNFGYIDDSEHSDEIHYTRLDKSQGYWGFNATGYSIGEGHTRYQNIKSIVDTGTSLLLLPKNIVDDYWTQIADAEYDIQAGGWFYPCKSALKDFTFNVGGGDITIPGFLIDHTPIDGDISTCVGGIQNTDCDGLAIFGDIALKAALVVFDEQNSRVGWANKPITLSN